MLFLLPTVLAIYTIKDSDGFARLDNIAVMHSLPHLQIVNAIAALPESFVVAPTLQDDVSRLPELQKLHAYFARYDQPR